MPGNYLGTALDHVNSGKTRVETEGGKKKVGERGMEGPREGGREGRRGREETEMRSHKQGDQTAHKHKHTCTERGVCRVREEVCVLFCASALSHAVRSHTQGHMTQRTLTSVSLLELK